MQSLPRRGGGGFSAVPPVQVPRLDQVRSSGNVPLGARARARAPGPTSIVTRQAPARAWHTQTSQKHEHKLRPTQSQITRTHACTRAHTYTNRHPHTRAQPNAHAQTLARTRACERRTANGGPLRTPPTLANPTTATKAAPAPPRGATAAGRVVRRRVGHTGPPSRWAGEWPASAPHARTMAQRHACAGRGVCVAPLCGRRET